MCPCRRRITVRRIRTTISYASTARPIRPRAARLTAPPSWFSIDCGKKSQRISQRPKRSASPAMTRVTRSRSLWRTARSNESSNLPVVAAAGTTVVAIVVSLSQAPVVVCH